MSGDPFNESLTALERAMESFLEVGSSFPETLAPRLKKLMAMIAREQRREARLLKVGKLISAGVTTETVLSYRRWGPSSHPAPVTVKEINPLKPFVKAVTNSSEGDVRWIDPLKLEVRQTTSTE